MWCYCSKSTSNLTHLQVVWLYRIIISLGNALRREQIKPGYNIRSSVYLHFLISGKLRNLQQSQDLCFLPAHTGKRFSEVSDTVGQNTAFKNAVWCRGKWFLMLIYSLANHGHCLNSSCFCHPLIAHPPVCHESETKVFFWDFAPSASQSMGQIAVYLKAWLAWQQRCPATSRGIMWHSKTPRALFHRCSRAGEN